MSTIRPTSQATLSAAPAAAPRPAPGHPEIRDQVSLQGATAPEKAPAAPEKSLAPAGSAKSLPTPASAAEARPAPPTTLLMEEPRFEPVPGVPHIAVATVSPAEMARPQALAADMKAQMKAWPSLKAVISVASDGTGESQLLVASRPEAIKASRLEGVYEVVQRLASSKSIKEQARTYPCRFDVVHPLDKEGTLHQMHLAGRHDARSVAAALAEGGRINDLDQVRDLVHHLPRGKRVALLIAGPSAAGKSTIIKAVKQYAAEIGRNVTELMGDMYFKDVDQPGLPQTPKNTPYWDHIEFMDMPRFKEDIARLIKEGEADTPVYNFQDVRPGGWRIPTPFTGFREDKPRHIKLGDEDILVIDSLHAANAEIISHLDKMGLDHATLYLDAPTAETRLVRRLVRDYAERGGRLPKDGLDIWDNTTWPGEVEFVRPTILQMDPGYDTFLTQRFPKDVELDRAQLEERVALLDQYGLPPTYESIGAPAEQLGQMARDEEKRLEGVIADPATSEADRSRAQKALERLRSAPRYQG
ncbi:MAG TPA: hypothetical protein VNO81_13240 [Candidatus Nitrosotenuis sp.]|jgi:uridine kinase|nr:hypothetical protein [Candidatus Nitrosotenuis sp.]